MGPLKECCQLRNGTRLPRQVGARAGQAQPEGVAQVGRMAGCGQAAQHGDREACMGEWASVPP